MNTPAKLSETNIEAIAQFNDKTYDYYLTYGSYVRYPLVMSK